jgi:hypothetical protein
MVARTGGRHRRTLLVGDPRGFRRARLDRGCALEHAFHRVDAWTGLTVRAYPPEILFDELARDDRAGCHRALELVMLFSMTSNP